MCAIRGVRNDRKNSKPLPHAGGGHAGPDEVLDKDRLSAGRGMGEGGALHGGGAGLEVAGGLSSFHGGGIHQMGESQNSDARGTQDTHTVPPPPPPTHMQHGRGHGESLHILHKQPQRHASAAAAVLDSVEARRGAGVDVMVVGEGGCEYVMESENMDLEDLGRDSSSLAGSNAESDVSTHCHALPHTASRCNRHTQRGLIRVSPSPPPFLWISFVVSCPPPF